MVKFRESKYSAQGKNCGSISDGCGGTLSCGTCTLPQTCGANTANVCGFPAWFQTAGGDVHANGRLGTTIPPTCGTVCSIGHFLSKIFSAIRL